MAPTVAMADQRARALSVAPIPPPSDPGLAIPEKFIVAFLDLMGGPYLLCEPNIKKVLHALRSLVSAILESKNVRCTPT